MWEWREDTGPAAGSREPRHGGWRLDHDGAWVWDPRLDPHAAQRAARVERLRPAMATLAAAPGPAPDRRLSDPRMSDPRASDPRVSHPRGGPEGWESTPIFRSVASDRERRLRVVDHDARRARIPEPHPGSGPLPVQYPAGGRGRLAPVETVPPPAWESEPAGSPDEELRLRAERRRRPRREHGGGEARGRHELRSVPVDDRGRHAFR